jgi:hypothetical protein
LEAKRLQGIRIPSEAEEAHRILTRTRQQLEAIYKVKLKQERMTKARA